MLVCKNMYETKVKEENILSPLVDNSVGLQIGLIEHALDVLSINFYVQDFNFYEIQAIGL